MENPDPNAHKTEDEIDLENGLNGQDEIDDSPPTPPMTPPMTPPIKVTPETDKIFKKMLSWSADTM